MKNFMKKLGVFLFIFSLLYVCYSFFLKPTPEEMIEDRIQDFCTAYNAGDFEATIACFDAKTRNTIEKELSLAEGLLGIFAGTSVDMFSFFSNLWGISVGYMSEGDMLTIDIESITVVSQKTATVVGKMRYADTLHEERNIVRIEMVCENKGWYIRDMKSIDSN